MQEFAEPPAGQAPPVSRTTDQAEHTVERQPEMRALLHRWFIQYNPLYLASAALVLAGATLLSHALSQESLRLGGVAVGGVAEFYACALIGGAAFLTRLGQHRPAALLALLAALYQCDLTLQVETYAYYGRVGDTAALLWVLLFAGKLIALAKALRLRLSRSAFFAPVMGASALALLPHIARGLDPESRTALVSLAVFGVGAAALWTRREVTAGFTLDPRARRALRGTWILWGGAMLAHVGYWVIDLQLEPAGLLPPLALLGARFIDRERPLYAALLALLLATAAYSPAYLSITALLAGVVLVLRALRRPLRRDVDRDAPRSGPYRIRTPRARAQVLCFQRADRAELRRLLIAALACNYVCIWAYGWSGGQAPEHALWLDALFVTLNAGWFLAARVRVAVVPALFVLTHLGFARGWIELPREPLEIAVTTIALGFLVLLGTVLTSWRLGRSDASRGSLAHVASARAQ